MESIYHTLINILYRLRYIEEEYINSQPIEFRKGVKFVENIIRKKMNAVLETNPASELCAAFLAEKARKIVSNAIDNAPKETYDDGVRYQELSTYHDMLLEVKRGLGYTYDEYGGCD